MDCQLLQKAQFKTSATYNYMLCGWHTRSDLPLTSLEKTTCDGTRVDILIQIARGRPPVAKNAGPVFFQHSLERSLIKIENVADFEVTMGRQIRIWPAARSTQKDIEIYLFG